MPLRHLSPSEICLSRQQAWKVLVFFFGGNAGTVPGYLADEDIEFAQALLMEAITASSRIGWVEAIFDNAMALRPDIREIIEDIAVHAIQEWQRSREPREIMSQPIYRMVHAQLVRNFRSIWIIRVETGEASGLESAFDSSTRRGIQRAR
jgi:hypothetical protein